MIYKMIQTEQYINFLIDNNLTQGQYLLLHLLKEKRLDLIKNFKDAFPLNEGTMIPKLEIKDLIEKGFILKKNKKYLLSKKILDIFVTPEVAVDEIYNLYPSFILNELGTSIPLTTMDKRIFKEIYLPKINGNIFEHKEVLADIKYGIDNGLIRVGINKFLTSEQWKQFRKLREPFNTTIITEQEEDF